MIRTFSDKATQQLFEDGTSKKFPADIQRRALRKLTLLDKALNVEDLGTLPSNRLHKLQGDRDGQWSISINDQWRICSCFLEDGVFDVEICNYH